MTKILQGSPQKLQRGSILTVVGHLFRWQFGESCCSQRCSANRKARLQLRAHLKWVPHLSPLLREVGGFSWSYCVDGSICHYAVGGPGFELALSRSPHNLSVLLRNPRPMKQPKQSSQGDTKSATKPAHRESPAVLFDLDGTLIDSNYQHVNAWSEALLAADIVIPRWKIHRRVGMSGKSMLQELLREIPRGKHRIDLDQLEKQHDRNFRRTVPHLQPLPGANELLAHLFRHKIRVAIATTGGKAATTLLLRRLKLPPQMPVVTGDDVKESQAFARHLRRSRAPCRCRNQQLHRCRRQRMGSARRGTQERFGRGILVRRICAGGTGARRRIPRLFRCCGHAHAY